MILCVSTEIRRIARNAAAWDSATRFTNYMKKWINPKFWKETTEGGMVRSIILPQLRRAQAALKTDFNDDLFIDSIVDAFLGDSPSVMEDKFASLAARVAEILRDEKKLDFTRDEALKAVKSGQLYTDDDTAKRVYDKTGKSINKSLSYIFRDRTTDFIRYWKAKDRGLESKLPEYEDNMDSYDDVYDDANRELGRDLEEDFDRAEKDIEKGMEWTEGLIKDVMHHINTNAKTESQKKVFTSLVKNMAKKDPEPLGQLGKKLNVEPSQLSRDIGNLKKFLSPFLKAQLGKKNTSPSNDKSPSEENGIKTDVLKDKEELENFKDFIDRNLQTGKRKPSEATYDILKLKAYGKSIKDIAEDVGLPVPSIRRIISTHYNRLFNQWHTYMKRQKIKEACIKVANQLMALDAERAKSKGKTVRVPMETGKEESGSKGLIKMVETALKNDKFLWTVNFESKYNDVERHALVKKEAERLLSDDKKIKDIEHREDREAEAYKIAQEKFDPEFKYISVEGDLDVTKKFGSTERNVRYSYRRPVSSDGTYTDSPRASLYIDKKPTSSDPESASAELKALLDNFVKNNVLKVGLVPRGKVPFQTRYILKKDANGNRLEIGGSDAFVQKYKTTAVSDKGHQLYKKKLETRQNIKDFGDSGERQEAKSKMQLLKKELNKFKNNPDIKKDLVQKVQKDYDDLYRDIQTGEVDKPVMDEIDELEKLCDNIREIQKDDAINEKEASSYYYAAVFPPPSGEGVAQLKEMFNKYNAAGIDKAKGGIETFKLPNTWLEPADIKVLARSLRNIADKYLNHELKNIRNQTGFERGKKKEEVERQTESKRNEINKDLNSAPKLFEGFIKNLKSRRDSFKEDHSADFSTMAKRKDYDWVDDPDKIKEVVESVTSEIGAEPIKNEKKQKTVDIIERPKYDSLASFLVSTKNGFYNLADRFMSLRARPSAPKYRQPHEEKLNLFKKDVDSIESAIKNLFAPPEDSLSGEALTEHKSRQKTLEGYVNNAKDELKDIGEGSSRLSKIMKEWEEYQSKKKGAKPKEFLKSKFNSVQALSDEMGIYIKDLEDKIKNLNIIEKKDDVIRVDPLKRHAASIVDSIGMRAEYKGEIEDLEKPKKMLDKMLSEIENLLSSPSADVETQKGFKTTITKALDSIAERQKQLSGMVDNIKSSFDMTPEQKKELDTLKNQESEVNVAISKAKKDLERESAVPAVAMAKSLLAFLTYFSTTYSKMSRMLWFSEMDSDVLKKASYDNLIASAENFPDEKSVDKARNDIVGMLESMQRLSLKNVETYKKSLNGVRKALTEFIDMYPNIAAPAFEHQSAPRQADGHGDALFKAYYPENLASKIQDLKHKIPEKMIPEFEQDVAIIKDSFISSMKNKNKEIEDLAKEQKISPNQASVRYELIFKKMVDEMFGYLISSWFDILKDIEDEEETSKDKGKSKGGRRPPEEYKNLFEVVSQAVDFSEVKETNTPKTKLTKSEILDHIDEAWEKMKFETVPEKIRKEHILPKLKFSPGEGPKGKTREKAPKIPPPLATEENVKKIVVKWIKSEDPGKTLKRDVVLRTLKNAKDAIKNGAHVTAADAVNVIVGTLKDVYSKILGLKVQPSGQKHPFPMAPELAESPNLPVDDLADAEKVLKNIRSMYDEINYWISPDKVATPPKDPNKTKYNDLPYGWSDTMDALEKEERRKSPEKFPEKRWDSEGKGKDRPGIENTEKSKSDKPLSGKRPAGVSKADWVKKLKEEKSKKAWHEVVDGYPEPAPVEEVTASDQTIESLDFSSNMSYSVAQKFASKREPFPKADEFSRITS